MRYPLQLCFAVLLVLPAAARGANEPVFPKDAKLELLFTRTADIHGGLTEGPAAAPDGSIYFTDIPSDKDPGMILRFDPKTKQTTVFEANSGKANGMQFDAQGNLVACEGADYGGRRISRWNVKSKNRETVIDRYQGKKFNAPNDLTIDRQGRIYFTDPRYAGPESRELEHKGVYRVDTDGKVVEITNDIEQPNGIALSPDGKTLYLVDHNDGSDVVDPNPNTPPPKKGAMKVYAFPLGSEGLVAGPRKTLVDFGAENGSDGIRVDRAGRIFLTARSLKRPGIIVIDPTGKEVAFLPTGEPNQHNAKPAKGIPSNCEFGVGDDANSLYITADTSLYRVRTNTQGLHAARQQPTK
jgi:gluconolactonase